MIHRDLKPANIKVKQDEAVKVLDFVLAKALSDEPSEAEMANSPTLSMAATMQGMILGTAAYMAPEQAKGKRVDRRADVWAFGAVFYEMLTGNALHRGETAAETLASVLMRDSTLEALPADTPAAIRNLLRRCLEKNPKRRVQSAGEARIILEDVLSGTAPAEPAAAGAVPAARSPRAAWIASGVAAVLLFALGILSFMHFREKPPAPRVARFIVLPPEKTTFSTAPQVLAISPDGTKLAFLANSPGVGNFQIWIRPIDSLAAQLLHGTDGASQPFWSWDSRYIAFYADGKLKKISITGAPAQVLCDASLNGAQGSWNKDGVILFTLGSGTVGGSPLYRVSAAGGAPAAVTTVDSALKARLRTTGRTSCRTAITSSTWRLTRTRRKARSASGRWTRRKLKTVAERSVASAPVRATRIICSFSRDGTLMAQPFDATALRLTGDPVSGSGTGAGEYLAGPGGVRRLGKRRAGLSQFGRTEYAVGLV